MSNRDRVCFWCGKCMGKERKTKDHLISKPLRKSLNCGNQGIVQACHECNQARARISWLFEMLGRLKKRPQKAKKHQRGFLRRRFQASELLELFSNKIKEKLDNKTASYCLHEINSIIEYEPIMEEWMKYCKRCGVIIPTKRIEILPDTKLCVKCSEDIGSD